MKLFYRVLIHLLAGIFVVLSAWAFVFYWGMIEEVNDEVDDSLEDYSELIIMRSLAGKDLPSNDNGSNNQYFLREVDAACVYHNAPTSFTDGAQFGLGAEIGISTQKLHARGPMALEEITTSKYVIRGNGQTRS